MPPHFVNHPHHCRSAAEVFRKSRSDKGGIYPCGIQERGHDRVNCCHDARRIQCCNGNKCEYEHGNCTNGNLECLRSSSIYRIEHTFGVIGDTVVKRLINEHFV